MDHPIQIEIPDHLKSAEIVASVDDLLTEILLRLPVRSLIRFQSVSKHWHSLIANPDFRHLRSRRKQDPAVGLFIRSRNFNINGSFDYVPLSYQSSDLAPPFRKLRFGEDSSRVTIVHSCNGLLLCRSDAIDHQRESTYYVYNPTTKDLNPLPKLDEKFGSVRGMVLAFDPVKSPHYSVVAVHRYRENPNLSRSCVLRCRVQIYSSVNGSWRLCGEPFPGLSEFQHPVYWNNVVPWRSYISNVSLCFNIDREAFDRMPMPPIPDDRTMNIDYFGESCGYLHFIEACPWEIQFDIYEMRRDNSEWFVKYQVDLSPVISAYPDMIRDDDNHPERLHYYLFHVVSLVRFDAEEEEEAFLVLQVPRRLIRIDLITMAFEKLHEFDSVEVEGELEVDGGFEVLRRRSHVFQYIESLSSV